METNLVLYFVLGYLAVYRLTYMVVRDEGPFEIFERLRGMFVGNNWMGRGIRCPYCVSFWMGLAVAPMVSLGAAGTIGLYTLLIGLALSGAFVLTLDLMRFSK